MLEILPVIGLGRIIQGEPVTRSGSRVEGSFGILQHFSAETTGLRSLGECGRTGTQQSKSKEDVSVSGWRMRSRPHCHREME